MSIKSKKAEEKLSEFTRYISIDWRPMFESAVEIAESDARERAVRALRKSCADNENGYCAVSRVIGDDGYPTTMFCGYKCDIVKEFLKHYDHDR